MLSYQHEFHAGNYADVIKHLALLQILKSLGRKEKPFTIIDSHAGAGLFNLEDERALKTAEACDGIKKLKAFSDQNENLPEAVKAYVEFESPFLEKKEYAGSPVIEQSFLRDGDKFFAVEKHPAAVELLKTNLKAMHKNGSVTVEQKDSYEALKSLVPPQIKRGLVLVDPSYEDESDYTQVAQTLSVVHKKWNTAIIALWYPLLTTKSNLLNQMLTEMEYSAKLGQNPCEYMKFEFAVKQPQDLALQNKTEGEHKGHMYGTGMFIMNPPYQLKETLEDSRSFLEKALLG